MGIFLPIFCWSGIAMLQMPELPNLRSFHINCLRLAMMFHDGAKAFSIT